MSTGRVLWIIWCLMWAGWWAAMGCFLVLPWLLVIPSLGGLLLPVGRPRRVIRQAERRALR